MDEPIDTRTDGIGYTISEEVEILNMAHFHAMQNEKDGPTMVDFEWAATELLLGRLERAMA